MRKLFRSFVFLSLILLLTSCGKSENTYVNENAESQEIEIKSLESESQNDEVFDSGADTYDTGDNNNQNNSEEYLEDEVTNNWIVIPDCFYGTYSQELTYENGTDSSGNTIWETFVGEASITEDSIKISLPEGDFEFTPENSILYLNNFIQITPLIDTGYTFILYDEETLSSGRGTLNIQIENGNYINQYALQK